MCDHMSPLNTFNTIQLVSAVSQLVNLPLSPASTAPQSLCGTSGLSVSLMVDQGCHKRSIGL